MQKTELAQCDQLYSSHVTHLSNVGVVVVMVTAQFPDVVVAAMPHSGSSETHVCDVVNRHEIFADSSLYYFCLLFLHFYCLCHALFRLSGYTF